METATVFYPSKPFAPLGFLGNIYVVMIKDIEILMLRI